MRDHRIQVALAALSVALALGTRAAAASPQGTDDQSITNAIEAKLFQDSTLKTQDIRVTTQDGVVTLTGTVGTQLQKSAAARMASLQPGVKKVMDGLRVAAGPAAGSQAEASGESPTSAKGNSSGSGVTVPSGTVVTVRMIDRIDSKKDQPGQEFAATLNSPVVVGNEVVFPQGSDAKVRLVVAKQSGHFKGASELSLELVSITAAGKAYNVESGYYVQSGSSRGKRTAEAVGAGAVVGGLIGALAGGGKGAAIGAGAGAGTGAGVQAVTRGASVKVPSETKIDFTLKSPVTVTP